MRQSAAKPIMPKEIFKRKKGYKRPPFSEEWKKNIALASMGNKSNWKGDKVGYWGIHRWLDKVLGRPMKCETCGDESLKRYEWANISGKYYRDTQDYIRLCKKCHCKMDKETWGNTTKLINNWNVQRL